MLVKSGELNLDSLSKDELEIICDKEMEALYVDEKHDISLLNTCSLILSKFDKEEFNEYWNRRYDIKRLNDKIANSDLKVTKKKYISVRRKIGIAIAVAVIFCVFAVSVVAIFDPFTQYGFSIHELFNHKGDAITGESYEVNISDSVTYFDTFRDLLDAVNFDILIPNENLDYRISEIRLVKYSGYNEIYIEILINNSTKTNYSVCYGTNIPEALDENNYANDSLWNKSSWNGYNIYFLDYQGTQYANLYIDNNVYEFVFDSTDSITLLLNNLK